MQRLQRIPDRPARDHPLVVGRLAESTRIRYDRASRAFVEWYEREHYVWNTNEELDRILFWYISHLFGTEGGSAQRGIVVRSAVATWDPWCQNFPLSDNALRCWQKLTPPRSWPPITWPAAVVIAGYWSRHGCFPEAVASLLAFHAFLRANEALGLYREDVHWGSAQENFHPAIRIRHAKTGPNQSVELFNTDVVELLRIVWQRTRPGEKLFQFTANAWRARLKEAMAALGMSDTGWTLHSYRHGGATALQRSGASMADVLHRGRWRSQRSATLYVQVSIAQAIASQLPEHITIWAEELQTPSLAVKLRQLAAIGNN